MIILFEYFLLPVYIICVVLFAIGIYFYRDKNGRDIIGIKDDDEA